MEDTTTARKINGTWYVRIIPSFARHIHMSEENDAEGCEMTIKDETNKRGQTYVSIWKKGK